MAIYTLFVILFGAVVRITGSGAGCGQHWPTCHGEIAHLPKTAATVIELTHRVTSGLCLVFVVALAVWTFFATARGERLRKAAGWACVFMVVEALVGAALVLLELVGLNDSWRRAAVMAIHLVNTCVLMFWIVAGAYWARRPAQSTTGLASQGAQRDLLLGALAIVAVSAAGAVTALGDTLYPVEGGTVSSVVSHASSEGGHFLEQLRGFHPLLAVLVVAYLLMVLPRLEIPAGLRNAMIAVIVFQVALGVTNIFLSAPGWMQVAHLAVANALWTMWALGWLSIADKSSRVA